MVFFYMLFSGLAVSSVLSLLLQKKHILGMLISLEGIMLSSLGLVSMVSWDTSETNHLFLVVLVFAAGEAAMGLALLVGMLRLRSNDLVSSLRV